MPDTAPATPSPEATRPGHSRLITVILAIGLIWYTGFRLTLLDNPTSAPLLAASEGPYLYGQTGDGERRIYRAGDILPPGTRLEAQPSARMAVEIAPGALLENQGAADITIDATRAISLNEGTFMWTCNQAGSREALRLGTPFAGLSPSRQEVSAGGDPVDARIRVFSQSVEVEILEGRMDATIHDALHTLTPGIHVITSTGYAAGEPVRSISPDEQAPADGAISGEIVDASGQPLRTVEAALTAWGSPALKFRPVGTSGTFAAQALKPGAYTLSVVAPHQIPTGVPRIDLDGGQTSHHRITMRPGLQLLGFVGSGLDDKPLLDAIVSAKLHSEDWRLLSSTESWFQRDPITRTQHQGIFALSGLVPGGHYDLEIQAEGYARETFQSVRSDAHRMAVLLKPGGAIRGRVYDDAGAPAPYAFLLVHDATGALAATRTCDHSGGFRAGNLKPGAYYLNPLRRRDLNTPAQDRGMPVEIPSATEVTGIRLRLRNQEGNQP